MDKYLFAVLHSICRFAFLQKYTFLDCNGKSDDTYTNNNNSIVRFNFKIGLHDNLFGLIIPAIPSAFGASHDVLFKIPNEFEEASVIDGAFSGKCIGSLFTACTPGMIF